MQFEVVFLLLFGFCYSKPHEGFPLLNPGGIGGIFKGPNSETIIRGPDGSEITSEAKGGAVIQDDGLANKPIVVAEAEIAAPLPVLTEERIISPGPIIASTGAPILASAAPFIASVAPILPSSPIPLLTGETYNEAGQDYIDAPVVPIAASPVPILTAAIAPVVAPFDVKPIEIIQQDPHIIETEIVEAPDFEPDQSSDLKGPSGRIITKGSASIVSGPASTTITEPRKIIVAPPKIAFGTPVIVTATIPLKEVPLVASLPPVIASTVAPLPAASFEASSTLAPPLLSYSTTSAGGDLAYSTTAAPLIGVSSSAGFDSSKINFGIGEFRESIPVIEYSSSYGVLNGQNLAALGVISSTEAPIALSSTISAVTTDKFAPQPGPVFPSAYLLPPAAPENLAPTAVGLVSSTASPNIQKITRIEDSIAIDGRVDMGDMLNKQFTRKSYQLPQVLSMALSRLYRKTPVRNKDSVIIDDKLGELAQNEITSYDSRISLLPPPDLTQSKYIAPALAQNGIDGSKVNLAPVPLSQVRRLPVGTYPSGFDREYLTNRYERNAKRRF